MKPDKHPLFPGPAGRIGSGGLLGGSASWQCLAAIAAATSTACDPPAVAAAPQRAAPASLLGFSLAEPADSAAYSSHAAPVEASDLWRRRQLIAVAAISSTSVRLVPVPAETVPRPPCSRRTRLLMAPSPLAGIMAAKHDLAAAAQAQVTQALKVSAQPSERQVRAMYLPWCFTMHFAKQRACFLLETSQRLLVNGHQPLSQAAHTGSPIVVLA